MSGANSGPRQPTRTLGPIRLRLPLGESRTVPCTEALFASNESQDQYVNVVFEERRRGRIPEDSAEPEVAAFVAGFPQAMPRNLRSRPRVRAFLLWLYWFPIVLRPPWCQWANGRKATILTSWTMNYAPSSRLWRNLYRHSVELPQDTQPGAILLSCGRPSRC